MALPVALMMPIAGQLLRQNLGFMLNVTIMLSLPVSMTHPLAILKLF